MYYFLSPTHANKTISLELSKISVDIDAVLNGRLIIIDRQDITSKIFQTLTQSSSGLRIETCDLKKIIMQFVLFTCIDIVRMTFLHGYVKINAETSRVMEIWNHLTSVIMIYE